MPINKATEHDATMSGPASWDARCPQCGNTCTLLPGSHPGHECSQNHTWPGRLE